MTRIQLRHDTAANFASVNPVLLAGEVGVETDTNKMKIGDGTTAYNSLDYFGGDVDLSNYYNKTQTDGLLDEKQDSIDELNDAVFPPTEQYKSSNVTIVGSLSDNEGLLSGFSTTNYANLPQGFSVGANTAEFVFKFNSTAIDREQTIFAVGTMATGKLQISVSSSNTIKLTAGSNSKGSVEASTSPFTISINTDYWVKCTFDGGRDYSISYSTDGINYSSPKTITHYNYFTLDDSSLIPYLGVSAENTNALVGTIDLKECYIKIGNQVIWKGTENQLVPDYTQTTFFTKSEIASLLPSVMAGATSSTAGASGLVPAPAAGDDTKFLSGDGTYKTVSADLSNVYTKTETDALLVEKQDAFQTGQGLDLSVVSNIHGYNFIDENTIVATSTDSTIQHIDIPYNPNSGQVVSIPSNFQISLSSFGYYNSSNEYVPVIYNFGNDAGYLSFTYLDSNGVAQSSGRCTDNRGTDASDNLLQYYNGKVCAMHPYLPPKNLCFINSNSISNTETAKINVCRLVSTNTTSQYNVNDFGLYTIGTYLAMSTGTWYTTKNNPNQFTIGSSKVMKVAVDNSTITFDSNGALRAAISNKVTGTGITDMVALTQAQYDALVQAGTVDANTFYVIVASNS